MENVNENKYAMNVLKEAEERLEEAIENGTHDDFVYWRGYRDAAAKLAGAR